MGAARPAHRFEEASRDGTPAAPQTSTATGDLAQGHGRVAPKPFGGTPSIRRHLPRRRGRQARRYRRRHSPDRHRAAQSRRSATRQIAIPIPLRSSTWPGATQDLRASSSRLRSGSSQWTVGRHGQGAGSSHVRSASIAGDASRHLATALAVAQTPQRAELVMGPVAPAAGGAHSSNTTAPASDPMG